MQLNEVQDQLQEETRQKLGLNTKLREAGDEINRLQEQLEEEEDEKKAAQKQAQTVASQVRTEFFVLDFFSATVKSRL